VKASTLTLYEHLECLVLHPCPPISIGGLVAYVAGTWSQIASLPAGYTPRFFSSAVLPDGRVIIEGGEYNTGCSAVWTNKGAIYDPLANTWTSVTPPSGWAQIGDSQSTVLADGTYLQANCCDSPGTKMATLNPATLTWTPVGTGKFDYFDEEGWTLLPDGSVLTVDAYVGTGTCGKNTERYSPVTGTWTSAGNTPSQLADCANPANNKSFEMGPQVLRPDGTVVAFGGTLCSDAANPNCASGALSVVTPTAIFNTANSTWTAGPNIPTVAQRNYSLADAPAALLPNGNILFAASPNYQGFVTPTHFFEFATNNTISQVSDPTDAGSFTSFQWNFLVLPTGQIMAVETDGSNVWYYTPSGSPNPSWAPVITSAPRTVAPVGSYPLSGTQLNGLSQGAAYGDDQMAATNYPLVRITNTASGHVFYARTHDHSSMTVAPSVASTTNFTLPVSIERGPATMVVVANGIPSELVNIDIGSPLCCGDFNGDSKADVLWRNTSGQVYEWLLNGTSLIGGGALGTISSDWQIAGIGDFNGDGKADVLWRNNTSGEVYEWLLNGTSLIGGGSLGTISSDWQIE
jgi:hypothetical protein